MLLLFICMIHGSGLALAGIPVKHLELCSSTKKLCRVIIVPQPKKIISGVCTGNFKNIPCTVDFALEAGESSLKLHCGGFKQELPADTMVYKATALIMEEDEKQTFVNDKAVYISFSSKMLTLDMVEMDGEIKEHSIKLRMGIQPVPLTETECK